MAKGNYINNKWVQGSGFAITAKNPANGDVIWEAPSANQSDVDNAVSAARKAFHKWSLLPIEEREQYLLNFKDQLQKNLEALAKIISVNTGKPFWESKTEVTSMINKVDISIDAYKNRCPTNKTEGTASTSITRHKPHGVVAVFGPFNFPAHLPNGHIIPALLAGNTVIFKSSELTPLVAEATMEFWDKINLPVGVINMVQGGKETGQYLVKHQDINGIFFTGSANTGVYFSEELASKPEKILALEMGGNNPLVVSAISDLEAAAYLTIQSAFLTAGQRCTCARRLIVLKGAQGDNFLKTLISMTKTIVVGSYTTSPEPFMGPVISETAAQNILNSQKSLIQKGGKPLIEMKHIKAGTGFLSPGVIDMSEAAEKPDKEIFGPLLQIIRVPNFETAIKEANNTAYGLTAGLLSENYEEYQQFFNEVKAGIINWNTQTTGASSAAPFGGIKLSGNYRPSAYYAADYCAYPVASMESKHLKKPATITPGISFTN